MAARPSLRRAAAVKAPAIKIVGAVFTVPHAHGCTTCHGRYEDNCADSATNAQCGPCRGHAPWVLLVASRLPKDCCRAHSRPADKDQMKLYRLSPACDWFRCTACSRTFPFSNPTEVAA